MTWAPKVDAAAVTTTLTRPAQLGAAVASFAELVPHEWRIVAIKRARLACDVWDWSLPPMTAKSCCSLSAAAGC